MKFSNLYDFFCRVYVIASKLWYSSKINIIVLEVEYHRKALHKSIKCTKSIKHFIHFQLYKTAKNRNLSRSINH